MPRRTVVLTVVAAMAVALQAAGSGRAGPAGAVIVLGVDARSSSAAIRWQAPAGARVLVESGLTDDLGVWSKAARAAVSGAGETRIGGLEPATEYRFRVVALSGGRRMEARGTFATQATLPWTTAATTPNGLFLDHQPFFPRMVWEQCPWAFPQSFAAGVNVFMGTGCGDVDAQLAALGGRAYAVLDAADRRGGRGVIGYHLPDEPDLRYDNADPLPVLPPSRISKRVTFLTLSNHFFSWASPLPQGRGVYPGFIAKAEMVGFNLYPLQNWCRKDSLPGVYDAQREMAALAKGKPTFQWIESAQMEFCLGLEPSPAIVRAETWLAIAGGARGIGWFPAYWRPDVAQEMGRISRQIAALAPALLAPEVAVTTPPGSLVRAGARRYNGATYVLAANASFARQRAVFTVPGLTATAARVYGEGRTVAVRKGTIVDGFRGLAVHVYVVDPPGAS